MNAKDLVHTYGDMLYRICLMSLRNHADAEDAVQEVFLKYLTRAPDFDSPSHEKAWLITVALNHCRNMLRNQRIIPTDPELLHPPENPPEQNQIFDALMQVPEPFREVLILHYIEGYPLKEIAGIIGKSTSAAKMRLSKGKRLLEEIYRKEYLS